MIDPARRTALTTGANSGIGFATCIELARRGHRSVGSVRSEATAAILDECAKRAAVEVECVLLDVTDPAACARVIEEVAPDILINNAGCPVTGAIEEVGDDEARRALETMVVAPMRLARLAIPAMRERGYGRIINLSSIYGITTSPLTGWYQGCKHALEGLSDALRMETAGDEIYVVLIEPGGVLTGIWEKNAAQIAKFNDSRFTAAYQRMLASARRLESFGCSAEACAAIIVKSIEARRPKARYLIGYDARFLKVLASICPTRMADASMRRQLGI